MKDEFILIRRDIVNLQNISLDETGSLLGQTVNIPNLIKDVNILHDQAKNVQCSPEIKVYYESLYYTLDEQKVSDFFV